MIPHAVLLRRQPLPRLVGRSRRVASSVTTVSYDRTNRQRSPIEFLWTARSEISAREGLDIAYEQLPIVDVDLNGLLLDLDNYRIPTHRDDEAAALKYLFASEDVLGAARLILRDGYFDNEVPIVISSRGKSDKPPYIVLEGNRRISALKALQDRRSSRATKLSYEHC